ncbi:MAG: hypothetical protein LIO46_04075, partial [Clostridiales bacterium]|nr:hypothetical protein [Clostridiales bacterium]
MLGKLMKYDFKATYRLFLVFYLGMLSFFVLGLIGRALDISQVRGTATVFLVLAGVGALFAALFYMITRYYRNVFGAEGYLTQTLPVRSGQILASKMLVTFVWLLVGAIGLILSVAGALVLYDLHGEVIEFLKALPRAYVSLMVIFAAVIFCSLFALINEVFFAVTLAHTRPFLQNGILMAVVFYFALNMAVGLLEAAGLMIFPLGVELTQ